VGAAPALAEETTGVEPAGEAERAAAAKSEALAPRMQGEARWGVETQPREGNEPPPEVLPQKGERKPQALPPKAGRMLEAPPQKGRRKPEALPPERECEVDKPQPETLPQKGECNPEALSRERKCERARTGAKRKPEVEAPARKGERERRTTPQGNPNEGKCEPIWPPREPSREVVLSTGGRPWDPGGKSPRVHVFESKRPVEANKSVAAGIVTCNKKNLDVQKSSHSNGTGNKTTTHLGHTPVSPSCRRGIHPFFVLRPAQRAQRRPGRCRGGKLQRGRLVAVTTPSHRRHSQSRAPRASHTHWPSNVCRH